MKRLVSATPADPGAVTTQPVRVNAAVHWRIEPPFAADAPSWLDAVSLAGSLCGTQLAQTARRAGFEPETVLMLSTLLPFTVTAPGAALTALTAALHAGCGHRLDAMFNAYLCAGWGFALRHLLRHTAARRVALVILDVDLTDLQWNLHHPAIGRSGFGITTVLMTLPAAADALPQCSGPHANSAFNEFVLALRSHQTRHGALPTFIPFLQGPLAATAERLLAPGSLGRNRHADYGHCFGADPWIGVIDASAERQAQDHDVRALLGAVAFNGYYTLAALDLAADIVTGFVGLNGRWAALQDIGHCPFKRHAAPSHPAGRRPAPAGACAS